MTNPLDPGYLATSAPLGPLAWIFFVLQIAGIAGGVYLAFMRRDSNGLRQGLLQRLGYALLVAGGIGVLLGALRWGNVGVFTQRYWFYLLLLAEVGLASYVVYYARLVYPGQLARSHTNRGKGGARPPAPRPVSLPAVSRSQATNGSGSTTDEHDEAAVVRGGRREARHRRKRKQR